MKLEDGREQSAQPSYHFITFLFPFCTSRFLPLFLVLFSFAQTDKQAEVRFKARNWLKNVSCFFPVFYFPSLMVFHFSFLLCFENRSSTKWIRTTECASVHFTVEGYCSQEIWKLLFKRAMSNQRRISRYGVINWRTIPLCLSPRFAVSGRQCISEG
jgi:hypothetical protein